MRNVFSATVIAAALALLVPNNGAEAVSTVAGMMTRATAIQPVAMPALASVTEQAASNVSPVANPGTPDPTVAWLMALGFLGVVLTRRIRGE